MANNHNLGDFRQCVYWRVTQPIVAFAQRGFADSNTYVGASQMLGTVFQQVTLQPGDELHSLPGGLFAICGDAHDTVLEVRLSLDEKHPFEKRYFPIEDEWPLDSVERTETPHKPAAYRSAARDARFTYDELHNRGAQLYRRNIDWVLPRD